MKKLTSIFAVLSTLCTFSASAAFIDFDSATIGSYGYNQDKIGTVTTAGTSIELTGNVWKSIIDTFVITSTTHLNFEFSSSIEAEISAIGFDNGNVRGASPRTFQLAGTQTFGMGNFNTYNVGDGFTSFSINVGDFYTGTFDRMFLILDQDDTTNNVVPDSIFRNVEICQSGNCMTAAAIPEPAVLGLIALGLFGLRRNLK